MEYPTRGSFQHTAIAKRPGDEKLYLCLKLGII